jgi:tetratricopeptide (TPR) repeat protein
MRHQGVWLTAFLAVFAAGAMGDELVVEGLTYPSVRIITVKDYQVVAMVRGRPIGKSLGQTDRISINGRTSFNQAESLLDPSKPADKRQPAQAIRAYKAALNRGGTDWMKKLIRYRLLRAYQEAGQIDEAVSAWLELIKGSGDAPVALAEAVPSEAAKKGSRGNALAIRELEKASDDLGSKPLQEAARKLLLTLYRAEGRSQDAARLAGRMTGRTDETPQDPRPSDPDDRTPSRPQVPAVRSGRLQAFSVLVENAEKAGDASAAAQAEGKIRGILIGLTGDQLPGALYLLARSQALQPGRDKQIQAGLNYMRVVTYFPASRPAAHSLLEAGRISNKLGNPKGAANAYRSLIRAYGNSDVADDAKAALESLNR